jgi:cytochrome c
MLKASLLGAALAFSATASAAEMSSIGTPIAEEDIALWNIDVNYLGENLPEGSSTAEAGEPVYQAKCAMCHGEFGEGARRYLPLAGGDMDTLVGDRPEKTIGSYWHNAPGIFDYIRRAMPFFAPQTLTDEEVYGIVAFILNMEGLVEYEETVDAEFLRNLEMPNKDNFWSDDRPDVQNERCMSDCYSEAPEIKGKAVIGDISVGAVPKAADE